MNRFSQLRGLDDTSCRLNQQRVWKFFHRILGIPRKRLFPKQKPGDPGQSTEEKRVSSGATNLPLGVLFTKQSAVGLEETRFHGSGYRDQNSVLARIAALCRRALGQSQIEILQFFDG